MAFELLSIDLSNSCSKQCPFCYNQSNAEGNTLWTPDEVIGLAKDCVENGVKAISLGGGEPFEYDGIFRIIEALQPIVYLSVTTNGLPLMREEIRRSLATHRPDKIHITIHNPDDPREVGRVMRQISELATPGMAVGVNLLVAADKLSSVRETYAKLRTILSPKQIILVPMRFSKTPSPGDLAFVTDNETFQAPSCILKCTPPMNFCSVSWDKKVNFCSYASGKQPLAELTFSGIISALRRVDFAPCR